MSKLLELPEAVPVVAYLAALADEGHMAALRRIVAAPIEEWGFGRLYDYGARCLIGHAEDWFIGDGFIQARYELTKRERRNAMLGFDDLAEVWGLRSTVRAIKAHISTKLLETL